MIPPCKQPQSDVQGADRAPRSRPTNNPVRCTGSRQGAVIPPCKQPQSDVQGADRAPRSRPTNNPVRCTGSSQGAQIPPYKQPQSDVQGADRVPRSRPTNSPSQTYKEQIGCPDPALQTTQSDVQGAVRAPRSRPTNNPSQTYREQIGCPDPALQTTPVRRTGSRQGAQIPPYKQSQSDVQGADRAPRSRPTNNPSQTYREQTGRPDPALQTIPVRRTESRQGAVIPPCKQSQSDVQGADRAPRSRPTNNPSQTYREQTGRPDPALQTAPVRRTRSRQGAQIPPCKQPQSDVQGADRAP